MNRPHIIATDAFHLEVYSLTPQTKELLLQAAQNVERSVGKKRAKKPKEKFTTNLFKKDELLARYHKVPVYRKIMEFIEERIGDFITSKDIRTLIKEYYEQKMKRKMTPSSYRSYASAYIRYLKEHRNYIEQPDRQSWRKRHKEITVDDLKEPKPQEENKKDDTKFQYADVIYKKMGKGNGQPQIITVEQAMKKTDLNKEQVELGMSALIQQNLATQQPRGIQLREM